MERSGIPILSYAGWWDAAYQHAAIKRFLSVPTPGSRLVIGPWDHGGWQHIEPFVGSKPHDFNHDDLLLAFFDAHLRDGDPAALPSKPVAYYTMGEGKWKHADTWPPPSTPPVKTPTPYRTFERKDGKAMTPGVAEDLTFDLLPTSYLFRKGHRIRIAIAGADRDNFAAYPTPATWTVAHGATRITLPVVGRGM